MNVNKSIIVGMIIYKCLSAKLAVINNMDLINIAKPDRDVKSLVWILITF